LLIGGTGEDHIYGNRAEIGNRGNRGHSGLLRAAAPHFFDACLTPHGTAAVAPLSPPLFLRLRVPPPAT
jgi:hypothetical protein